MKTWLTCTTPVSGDYELKAAPGLLGILRRQGVARRLIVDLGRGSGRWAAELNRSGYDVIGVDQSSSMIGLARRIAPAGIAGIVARKP